MEKKEFFTLEFAVWIPGYGGNGEVNCDQVGKCGNPARSFKYVCTNYDVNWVDLVHLLVLTFSDIPFRTRGLDLFQINVEIYCLKNDLGRKMGIIWNKYKNLLILTD